MKCLPKDKIALANGVTLHDSHAEVLALRAFNHFLIQECGRVARGCLSHWVDAIESENKAEEYNGLAFRIRDGVKISMYCSEAPCGDASMELIMAEQEDATPWNVPGPINDTESSSDSPMHGRGYFSQLGVVRTKPCTLLLKSQCAWTYTSSETRCSTDLEQIMHGQNGAQAVRFGPECSCSTPDCPGQRLHRHVGTS